MKYLDSFVWTKLGNKAERTHYSMKKYNYFAGVLFTLLVLDRDQKPLLILSLACHWA